MLELDIKCVIHSTQSGQKPFRVCYVCYCVAGKCVSASKHHFTQLIKVHFKVNENVLKPTQASQQYGLCVQTVDSFLSEQECGQSR